MKVLVLAALMFLSISAFAKEVTIQIKVSGMTCGSCAAAVKSGLTKVKGVKSADVSVEKGQATVVYDDTLTNEQQLCEAINKTGFKAEPPAQDRK